MIIYVIENDNLELFYIIKGEKELQKLIGLTASAHSDPDANTSKKHLLAVYFAQFDHGGGS